MRGLRVLAVSRSYYLTFRVHRQDVLGRLLYALATAVPPLGALGVIFAVLGSAFLGGSSRSVSLRTSFIVFARDHGVRSMFVTAVIWSITSNLDKLAVRASTPLLWAATLTTFIAVAAGSRRTSWSAASGPPLASAKPDCSSADCVSPTFMFALKAPPSSSSRKCLRNVGSLILS
jgi:membrane associated rhomboid family serine protease